MEASNHLTVEAPAKVNLFLEITGRRADGYHDLVTFMQKLVLADTVGIAVRPGEGVRLTSTSPDLPLDDRNLAVRAAKAFLRETGKNVAVDLALEKRIPVAAGLGGGSSDAAAVLTGLNRIFGRPFGEEKLLSLALAIGADVPFLASDYPAAWATGIGECLCQAAPLSECWVVLVNPGFPVPTRWVYQTFDALASGEGRAESVSAALREVQDDYTFGTADSFALTTTGNPYILGREKGRTIKTEHPPAGDRVPLRNDLERVTIGRYRELREIKEKLLADGARGALMSGSGPTVFGIFGEEQDAAKSFSYFSGRYGENVFLTKPLQAI